MVLGNISIDSAVGSNRMGRSMAGKLIWFFFGISVAAAINIVAQYWI